ncbi:MAG TPA: hypothetical protein VIR03_02090 [Candidatus Saccharimonadales bacterium]
MNITPLEHTGNSTKYTVELTKKRGKFMISLSYTLCAVWQLKTDEEKLDAVTHMANAIVGRHNPERPFKDKYIFGDHNNEDSVEKMVTYLKRVEV